jgi:hypothetical protein
MNPPMLPPELQRLRRRFVTLMIVQGVLSAAAIAFGVAYFVFKLGWGLPAFAIALAAALVAQLRFVWMFRNGGS